ncbi:MAG TPA: type II toxin-antitoxin system HicB family antitoxin [Pseudomonadales bacterium]|jgi:predicted RNase H-like HicB family nuclease|nr:type II toxin-antitoxin system HicB family antitoxin [Pseudomonadales bacterium]HMY96527.1 type II toxin-antitoxin system HicB family antitoxin [Pseudomonadales bacterium]
MRYAIVIEKAGNNFSGYSPDLPGCVATGATIEETETELLSAIQFHLDGLREDGIAPPPCESVVEYVLIPVQPLAPGETPRVLQGG